MPAAYPPIPSALPLQAQLQALEPQKEAALKRAEAQYSAQREAMKAELHQAPPPLRGSARTPVLQTRSNAPTPEGAKH